MGDPSHTGIPDPHHNKRPYSNVVNMQANSPTRQTRDPDHEGMRSTSPTATGIPKRPRWSNPSIIPSFARQGSKSYGSIEAATVEDMEETLE